MRANSTSRKNVFPDTDIYCITSEEHSNGRDNIEVVKEMIHAGIKIIQYREKDKDMGEKYEQCLKIREMTRNAGVFFIVNDHVDLAMMTDADGIHLGQEDLPIEAVKGIVGNDIVIGLSTHSPSQAKEAIARGADYIGVGPIYKTQTKKNVCDPVGLSYLDYVTSRISIPFVAIGGIKAHNVSEVLEHGAGCVVMVTEIVGANDIAGKIKDIRNIIKKG
ncbi:MAG: thiamine phosphate synthase [Deltaproteobacteria bacterium]|nr:thiamine phosphate synthase [Deltaproteobacteria bacterium]